jgi:all-trans-8'-apo-beta-carotenal 15,15'-oxygenase
MMMPTRRSFLAGSAAAALGSLKPAPLFAADAPAGSIPAEEWRSIWTAPANELDIDGLAVHGRWPADLALTLYRNGPALHTMGGYRYRHWFDGDGMIRAWTVGPQGARVRTRLIRTAKLTAEQAAGRRLLPAFGSLPPGARADAMADALNPANINALPFAGSLLALWEAGSAYRLDQDTLETAGPVVWGKDLAGLPFSGHPHFDRDGTLWNFGLDYRGRLVVWEVGAEGFLRRCKVLDIGYAGLMHDFAVTDRHLLFVMPPLLIDRDRFGRRAFLDALDWRPDAGLRLVLVDKADLTVVRQTVVPARFVFHLNTAWEDADGTVFCDVVTFPDADIVQRDLAAIMDADLPRHPRSKFERLVWSPAGPARLEPSIDVVGVEFPRWAERAEGGGGTDGAGRSVLMHSDTKRASGWFNTLLSVDRERGVLQRWAAPDRVLLEEHLPVGRYVIGTGVDATSGHSFLHLFAADGIADGPIAWTELPVALPVGLHANVRIHQV